MTEFILDVLKTLGYIFENIFWLKECFTAGTSLLVFLLARWISKLDYSKTLFLYLGSIIGVTIQIFNNIGYLSSDDKLKYIAPTTLFLLAFNKKRGNDTLLYMFLVPYFIVSYQFYRGFYEIILSIIVHFLILFFIVFAKENIYFSLFVGVIVGALYNLIGYTSQPSTDDFMANPAFITLVIKRFEFYTKDSKYEEFLKSYWIVLVCFAYFGSWIFLLIEPLFPSWF